MSTPTPLTPAAVPTLVVVNESRNEPLQPAQ
jgi:hypothetical protein